MNLTPSTLAETDAHDSGTKLELVGAAAGLGIWDWDVLTNRIEYSERAKAICGFAPDQPITFKMVQDITHPDDYPWTSALARRSLDPDIRERRPFEYRIVRPDGGVRWVLAHGHAVFETSGGTTRATRYIGTIQDITPRKQMEDALRASNRRLRLALDAGRMAVWEYDVATATLTTSLELKRLLAFREDENPTIEEIRTRYFPGDFQRVQESAAAALKRGEPFFEVEFRYYWPDGSLRWLLLRAEILMDARGTPATVIGVLLDITERKEREEHLEFLMHELSHRSKNLLAIVQAMARLTGKRSARPEDFERELSGRIQALARTHDVLFEQDWRGANLQTLIQRQLEPFAESFPSRIRLGGPAILLNNSSAHDLSVAVYELLTNASKYGALSTPGGHIAIDWELVDAPDGARQLRLIWKESGGPEVRVPERRGFGTLVLERMSQASRHTTLEFAPDGVRWIVLWPASEFSATRPETEESAAYGVRAGQVAGSIQL